MNIHNKIQLIIDLLETYHEINNVICDLSYGIGKRGIVRLTGGFYDEMDNLIGLLMNGSRIHFEFNNEEELDFIFNRITEETPSEV